MCTLHFSNNIFHLYANQAITAERTSVHVQRFCLVFSESLQERRGNLYIQITVQGEGIREGYRGGEKLYFC